MIYAKRNKLIGIVIGILTLAYGVYYAYGHWKDSQKIPNLLAAARSGDRIGALALLDTGIPANCEDSHGRTPLMLAAARGHDDIVRALLDAGARANSRDEHGRTALMEAVDSGSPDLVALLIFWKADVNARRDDGATALKLARQHETLARNAVSRLPHTLERPPASARIVQMLEQAGARE